MARTIQQALDEGKEGFHIGTRLILPFKCQIIKIIIESEIFTELIGSKDIKLAQDIENTSIYFRSHGSLDKTIGKYEVVKIVASEWDADLSDVNTHIKLICEIGDTHVVKIHLPSEDMLFIE